MKNKIDKEKLKKKWKIILDLFTTNRIEKSIFFDGLDPIVEDAYVKDNQKIMKGINAELNLMLKALSDIASVKELIERMKEEKIWDVNE